MIRVTIIILSILSITSCFGQSNTDSGQSLEITEENLKKVFSLKHLSYFLGWAALYNTDTTYASTDTIRLYTNDAVLGLNPNFCNLTSWTFSDSTTFDLSETNICLDPSLSNVNSDNIDLKIKFGKINKNLVLTILNQSEIKDKFIIHSFKHYTKGYMLTMIRTL
jgi:hypothetical protein